MTARSARSSRKRSGERARTPASHVPSLSGYLQASFLRPPLSDCASSFMLKIPGRSQRSSTGALPVAFARKPVPDRNPDRGSDHPSLGAADVSIDTARRRPVCEPLGRSDGRSGVMAPTLQDLRAIAPLSAWNRPGIFSMKPGRTVRKRRSQKLALQITGEAGTVRTRGSARSPGTFPR